MKIINNQIYLEDVPVTELAQAYGTPTYVYEETASATTSAGL